MVHADAFADEFDFERRWATRGAVYLLLAFVCPFMLGAQTVWFPQLFDSRFPGIGALVAAPAVLGGLALFAAFKLSGLARATLLLLATGVVGILIMTVGESMATAIAEVQRVMLEQSMAQARAMGHPGMMPPPSSAPTPPIGGLLIAQLGVVLGFVGLGLRAMRDETETGARIAGVGGLMVLGVLLSPVDGFPIKHVFDGALWDMLWFVPATLGLAAAFGVFCLGLMFPLTDTESVAHNAFYAGLGVVLVPAVGVALLPLKVASLSGFMLMGVSITVVVKLYGTFIAMHILFAAGLLGLANHGLFPEAAGRR